MSDLICACATPPGTGALAVVRLSGNGLHDVLNAVLRPMQEGGYRPGHTRRVQMVDEHGVFDDGLVVVNEAPRSYTGEHTAEISCHGNPVAVDRLITTLVQAGARIAHAGEFTRRAVVNGKLDLVGAEAVLQVSRAVTRQGLAVARAGLDGRMHAEIEAIRAPWIDVAAELEARLDYPGDELARITDEDMLDRVRDGIERCNRLIEGYARARVWVDGARVALVGPVNAGKSTLFNQLVGRNRALVHHSAGTTRDVLEIRCVIGGVPVILLDTAGERVTADPVEAAGLALARELVAEADLLLVIVPAELWTDPVVQGILQRTADRPRLLLHNGVDREGAPPAQPGSLSISAKRGDGLTELSRAIRRALVGVASREAMLAVASGRQRDRLRAAVDAASEVGLALPYAGVAVAADAITRAIEALDELTGSDTREDVLDALFARFCIGK